MKKIIALLLALVMVFALVACGQPAANESKAPDASKAPEASKAPDAPEVTGTVQGVDYEKGIILVGNTAATTGAFAAVGVPFNAGLEAALKAYNDAGGFGEKGLKVEFVHYDDGFDAAQGLTYTKQLVEDDKVFALVGHFGTNTVGATMDYIKSVGVPTPYFATGISALYGEALTGKEAAYFPVQPIYDGEGRMLFARAVGSTDGNYGLGGTKVGVIATTDDAGSGMLSGIKRQASECSIPVVYQEVDPAATDYTAAVSVLMNQGCDVVILAMNQAPLVTAMNSMRDLGYNAKCITSYVNASVATLGALVDSGAVTADRPVYSTSWMDATTEQGLAEYGAFAEVQLAWEAAEGIDASNSYVLNSYAMAGYVAGQLFIHGLKQVEALGLDLTWENFTVAMESAAFHIPMGGDIDYANGDRLGVTALALNTISLEHNADTGYYELLTVSPIMGMDEVWATVG